MAYMSQEHKQAIAKELKRVIPKSWKWSLGVHHHSTLCLTIQSAPVDLVGEWARNVNRSRINRSDPALPVPNHADVNPYYVPDQFDVSREIMKSIITAMNAGNWDRSDSQTDYFDVGHYVKIHIGRWDKPFVLHLHAADDSPLGALVTPTEQNALWQGPLVKLS